MRHSSYVTNNSKSATDDKCSPCEGCNRHPEPHHARCQYLQPTDTQCNLMRETSGMICYETRREIKTMYRACYSIMRNEEMTLASVMTFASVSNIYHMDEPETGVNQHHLLLSRRLLCTAPCSADRISRLGKGRRQRTKRAGGEGSRRRERVRA